MTPPIPGACSNCGCEERDHRGILTCRCPDPRATAVAEQLLTPWNLHGLTGLRASISAALADAKREGKREGLEEAAEICDAESRLYLKLAEKDAVGEISCGLAMREMATTLRQHAEEAPRG